MCKENSFVSWVSWEKLKQPLKLFEKLELFPLKLNPGEDGKMTYMRR